MKKSKCETKQKCDRCGKVVYTRKLSLSDHECGNFECKLCGKWVDISHLCYLRRKCIKSTPGRFIFFDFESIQSEKYECQDGYNPTTPLGRDVVNSLVRKKSSVTRLIPAITAGCVEIVENQTADI